MIRSVEAFELLFNLSVYEMYPSKYINLRGKELLRK